MHIFEILRVLGVLEVRQPTYLQGSKGSKVLKELFSEQVPTDRHSPLSTKSLVPQRLNRVDACGAPGGKIAGHQCDRQQKDGNSGAVLEVIVVG